MTQNGTELRKKLDLMIETGSLRRVTTHMGGEYDFAQEMAKGTPLTGNALLREALRYGLVSTVEKYKTEERK